MTPLSDLDIRLLRGLALVSDSDGFTTLDRIKGTFGDDTLVGTDGKDNIHGEDGDDLIDGGGGNDLINAGHGADTVDGGDGDDTIFGNRGPDSLFGGAGDDYLSASTPDTYHNATETLDGGDGRDTIAGSFSIDLISGGRGADVIYGSFGPDTLNGGVGIDTVIYDAHGVSVSIDLGAGTAERGSSTAALISIENAEGGDRADVISGGGKANVLTGAEGADTLSGAGGSDSLHGGEGGDQITGGLGADVLEGGGGPDTFIYAHTVESDAAHVDAILDLVEGDVIDLSAIDADRTQAKDQAFHLVTGGLTGHAGELALVHEPGTDVTLLEGDVDGDGSADLMVQLSGDQTGFTGFVL